MFYAKLKVVMMCVSMIATFSSMNAGIKLHAQPAFTWGDATAYESERPSFYIAGKMSDAYYLLRYNAGSLAKPVVIERYNNRLSPDIKAVFLEGSRESLLGIFTREATLVLVYTGLAEDGRPAIKADIIDKDLSMLDTGRELITFDENPYRNGKRTFRWHYDPDNEMLVIVRQNSDNTFRIKVFNKQLNVVHSREIDENVPDDLLVRQIRFAFPYWVVLFADSGNDDTSTGMKAYFGSAEEEGEGKWTHLESESFRAVKGKLRYNKMKRRFQFAGLYKDPGLDKVKGFTTCYWEVNDPDPQPVWSETPDSDFYLQVGREASALDLSDFELNDMYLRSDGGAILVIEKRTETDRTLQGPGIHGIPSTMNRRFYNFQDVIVVSLNPEGEVHWNQVIKKEQRSSREDDILHSTGILMAPDKLHIFYNEQSRLQGLIIHEIDRYGERSSSLIQSEIKEGQMLIPRRSKQTGSGEVIVPVIHRNRQFSLVRINM